MVLGRVIGQVWATTKSPRLQGCKLLIVRPLTWHLPDHETDHIIAVDPVGAEVGQDVVVCLGKPARRVLGDPRFPVEASVAAIVDEVEVYMPSCRNPRFRFGDGREPIGLIKRQS